MDWLWLLIDSYFVHVSIMLKCYWIYYWSSKTALLHICWKDFPFYFVTLGLLSRESLNDVYVKKYFFFNWKMEVDSKNNPHKILSLKIRKPLNLAVLDRIWQRLPSFSSTNRQTAQNDHKSSTNWTPLVFRRISRIPNSAAFTTSHIYIYIRILLLANIEHER